MSLLTRFRRARPVVGLDIGSSAVKAVELREAGKLWKVVGWGVEPVPPDSIVDGAIIDGTAVADAIRRLFDGKRLKSKEVAASLSGNAVIVKKISVPAMTEAELADSIVWEAEQYIPFDIQDVNLDYQVLAPSGEAGGGQMDVLLVAAKKEKIVDYTGVITQAGRTPVIVDIDAFALQNAYEVNYGFTPGEVVALINAGASATNINIVQGDQSVFTRDVSIGGQAYTETLQKEMSLPREAAEALKQGGEPGHDYGGMTYEDARPLLRAVSESVLLEIQKTFDFYKATAVSDRLDRIAVSGGASRAEGFMEMLGDRFGAPVEPFDPFRRVKFDAAKFGVTDIAAVGPMAAVAVGLALRRAGDR
ncbi:MAG TPA: type IV pilus assembly protein PilM [Vicinamibacterales bacterium]